MQGADAGISEIVDAVQPASGVIEGHVPAMAIEEAVDVAIGIGFERAPRRHCGLGEGVQLFGQHRPGPSQDLVRAQPGIGWFSARSDRLRRLDCVQFGVELSQHVPQRLSPRFGQAVILDGQEVVSGDLLVP